MDEVVLIQTPPSISSGIQRIGRAGRDVGRISNGLLFPTHSHDFLESAIGELDEEFVWETKVGQTFTLGTQNWKIERITHNDVFVLPGNPRATAPPFWIAEPSNRNFHFSDKIGRFLERSNFHHSWNIQGKIRQA